MPANEKYIKIVGQGDEVNQDRYERLKKHNVNSVFVFSKRLAEISESCG